MLLYYVLTSSIVRLYVIYNFIIIAKIIIHAIIYFAFCSAVKITVKITFKRVNFRLINLKTNSSNELLHFRCSLNNAARFFKCSKHTRKIR